MLTSTPASANGIVSSGVVSKINEMFLSRFDAEFFFIIINIDTFWGGVFDLPAGRTKTPIVSSENSTQ